MHKVVHRWAPLACRNEGHQASLVGRRGCRGWPTLTPMKGQEGAGQGWPEAVERMCFWVGLAFPVYPNHSKQVEAGRGYKGCPRPARGAAQEEGTV